MESRYARYLKVSNPHKGDQVERYKIRHFLHTQFYKTAENKHHFFAWTIKKDDEGKFYAFYLVVRGGIHIANATLLDSKLVRCVKFSKKWKAKDRAYKWYCGEAEQEFKSLHGHALKGRNNFEKVYVCCCTATLRDGFDRDVEYFGQRVGKDKLCVEDRFGVKRKVPLSCFKEKTD